MQILILALLACFSLANTAVARETNAERLSRGLTPLRPKFRSILPGFSPTRVLGAKRNSPSSYPQNPGSPSQFTGRIQVRNGEGRGLGYLKNWAGPSPINGVNFGSENEELHVSFVLPAGKNGPFDILTTNPNFEEPYFVGVSSTASPAVLAAGQPNGIALINVQQTPPGSPPVHNETSGAYVESAIWYFDSASKQITAQYINPDGSKPLTVIAYNIRSNQLLVVGDLDAWNSQHANTPSSAVTFHLEDL